MYIIKKNNGLYVAKPGHKSSYTSCLITAQKYNTREEAERELCIENEHIVNLDRELDKFRR